MLYGTCARRVVSSCLYHRATSAETWSSLPIPKMASAPQTQAMILSDFLSQEVTFIHNHCTRQWCANGWVKEQLFCSILSQLSKLSKVRLGAFVAASHRQTTQRQTQIVHWVSSTTSKARAVQSPAWFVAMLPAETQTKGLVVTGIAAMTASLNKRSSAHLAKLPAHFLLISSPYKSLLLVTLG